MSDRDQILLARRVLLLEQRDGIGTVRGRLIYGAGIGLFVYLLRTWGGYPDGVAFSVLLMNGAVPLINRYTRPRIYGQR